MKKSYLILGFILSSLSILFTIIFIWTIDVSVVYYGNATNGVLKITETPEDFQVVWAILAIICLVFSTIFKIIGIVEKKPKHAE